MKVTKLEEVDRTYCDICKCDITRRNIYGYYDILGRSVDICGGGRQYLGDNTCEEKFLIERAFQSGDRDFG